MNIFTAKKYENKIKSIVTVSHVYSISELSSISGINEFDVITLLEKMIKKGANNNLEYRLFKNGHIDYKSKTIVLDESKSDSFVGRLGKMANSFVDKITPDVSDKNINPSWKCTYCGSLNNANSLECTNCGANKQK